MSDLLGDRDERYRTFSSSRNGGWGSGTLATSTAEQLLRVPIMSVAELAALPRGRALLFSSGNRPADAVDGPVSRGDPYRRHFVIGTGRTTEGVSCGIA